MESRFSHDFSAVRVHVDADANASARSINAAAYTVGQHVVMGKRQPSRSLLAHELVHVVQQSRGNTSSPRPDESHEHDARCAQMALASGLSSVRVTSPSAVGLARDKENDPDPDVLDAPNPEQNPRYVDKLFEALVFSDARNVTSVSWHEGGKRKSAPIARADVATDDSQAYAGLFKIHNSKADAQKTVAKWQKAHPSIQWYSYHVTADNVIMPTIFSAPSTPNFYRTFLEVQKDIAADIQDIQHALVDMANMVDPIPGTDVDENGNLEISANPLSWLPLLLHLHAIRSGRGGIPKGAQEGAPGGLKGAGSAEPTVGEGGGRVETSNPNEPRRTGGHDDAAHPASHATAATAEEASVHSAAANAKSEVKLSDGSVHGVAPYGEGKAKAMRFCSKQCSLVADKLDQIQHALPKDYAPKTVRDIEFLKNQVRGVDATLDAGLKSGKLTQADVDKFSRQVANEIGAWAKGDPNIDKMLRMTPDELKNYRVHTEVKEHFEQAQEGGKSSNVKVNPEGAISTTALERDVLDELGIKDPKHAKTSPGGKAQPAHFDVGNFGHEHAEELVHGLPAACDKEVVIDLGEGVTRRADRVHWNNKATAGAGGTVFEIKPNTGTWPQDGLRQASTYAYYMQQRYGGTWNAVCLTYDAAAVRQLLGL